MLSLFSILVNSFRQLDLAVETHLLFVCVFSKQLTHATLIHASMVANASKNQIWLVSNVSVQMDGWEPCASQVGHSKFVYTRGFQTLGRDKFGSGVLSPWVRDHFATLIKNKKGEKATRNLKQKGEMITFLL